MYKMNIEDFKKRDSLGTPDGYFKNLNDNIMKATAGAATENASGKARTLTPWTRIAGYAAAVAIVFAIAIGTVSTSGNREEAWMHDDMDEEFIDNILLNYPIDEYTFYCSLTDTDIND